MAEIVLNTGAASAAYSETFELSRNQPVVDVNDRARVSLSSEMALSLSESVYTTLQVSVSWESQLVYQQTFRVALLPPDEWRDDDANRIWLPSFVLPRDPVIAQIVDKSQKYLTTLEDDGGAGFDGYQGVLPTGAIEERCQSVDQQVRALWWSLIQEYQLGYINPPPSFTKMSQRLRTPTDTVTGRRGTCIDPTLLLAALLEYIDVYPVVFLLEGHAFPGYIRSEDSYAELRKLFVAPASMMPDSSSTYQGSGALREWILDKRYFSGIVQLVRDGRRTAHLCHPNISSHPSIYALKFAERKLVTHSVSWQCVSSNHRPFYKISISWHPTPTKTAHPRSFIIALLKPRCPE